MTRQHIFLKMSYMLVIENKSKIQKNPEYTFCCNKIASYLKMTISYIKS